MNDSLTTEVAGVRLKNPFIAASGTAGYIHDAPQILSLPSFGGAVTKTLTLLPKEGNPQPRVWETASGILNSIGLENCGVDSFVKEHLPRLRITADLVVFVSVGGEDPNQLCTVLERLAPYTQHFDSLELNLSCPNIKSKSMISQSPSRTERVVQLAKSILPKTPIFVKLTPRVSDILKISEAALEAGANGLVLTNTHPALALDRRTLKPALGGVFGGLSGAAVKPLTLFTVFTVYQALRCPIIASGGVCDESDAIEALAAGAAAVQLGTANLVNPGAIDELVENLKRNLAQRGFSSLKELVGFAHQP
ncbi:MAG: dihydroorotate dehydrogenase [Planctomycetota bacterium]|nr:dihydroorotate dehydrogenase [Planctomycetota bacterium]